MNHLKEKILKLENDLLTGEVRKSSERISEILDDNFVEFCSSGKEYHYKKGNIFQSPDDDSELDWEIVDFNIEVLSDDCVLALYKLIKNKVIDENQKYSRRSSIWKNYNGQWKIFFHQGTLTSKYEM